MDAEKKEYKGLEGLEEIEKMMLDDKALADITGGVDPATFNPDTDIKFTVFCGCNQWEPWGYEMTLGELRDLMQQNNGVCKKCGYGYWYSGMRF